MERGPGRVALGSGPQAATPKKARSGLATPKQTRSGLATPKKTRSGLATPKTARSGSPGSKPQLATPKENSCAIGTDYGYEPNYVLDARERLPLRSQWHDQRNSGQESAHHRPGLAVALNYR